MANYQCSICGKKSTSIPSSCPLCGQEGSPWIDLSSGKSKVVKTAKKRVVSHRNYKSTKPEYSPSPPPPIPDIKDYLTEEESIIDKLKDDYVYTPGYFTQLSQIFRVMFLNIKYWFKWELGLAIIIGIVTQGWVFINSSLILWLTIIQVILVILLSAQEWFRLYPLWYVPGKFYEIFPFIIGTTGMIYLLSYPARIFI